MLNLGGTGEFPGAINLNEEPGFGITQRMQDAWTTVPDASMEAVIGNKMTALDQGDWDAVASESMRVLQPGGEARLWTSSAVTDRIVRAFQGAGFSSVEVKGITVIAKKS